MYHCWIFLLMMVAACHTNQYTFREVGTYSDDPSSTQISKEQEQLESKITYRRAQIEKQSGLWVVQFDLRFDNVSNKAITLTPIDFVLLDDEGQRVKPKFFNISTDVRNFVLWPKTSWKLSIFFEFPSGYDLIKTGSLRLLWNYYVDSALQRRVTKFLKHEVEYRIREVAPYPRWYFYYPHWRWY